MRNARDPRWYRAEAARMRIEAARATETPNCATASWPCRFSTSGSPSS